MGGAPSTPSTPSTSPFCGPRTRTTMGMIPFRIARLRPNHSSRGTPGNSRSRRPTSGTFASRRKASPERIVGCVSRTPAPRLLSAPESAGYLPANVCPVELLSLVPQNLRGTIARGKEAGGAPSRPAGTRHRGILLPCERYLYMYREAWLPVNGEGTSRARHTSPYSGYAPSLTHGGRYRTIVFHREMC